MSLINKYNIICTPVKDSSIFFEYYPGFILRNALVEAMALLYCKKKDTKPELCEECEHRLDCVYAQLNLPARKNKTRHPQPFSLNTLSLETFDNYPKGSHFCFQLVLFGTANRYLFHFTEALKFIANTTGIGSKLGTGNERAKFIIKDFFPVEDVKENYPNEYSRVTVEFRYLHFDNDILKNSLLSFDFLSSSIKRRTNALLGLYGMGVDNIQIPQSKCDETIRIASHNLYKNILPYPPGGNMEKVTCYRGTIVYAGMLTPHIELLNLGSTIGIGQFTASGIGTYKLYYE